MEVGKDLHLLMVFQKEVLIPAIQACKKAGVNHFVVNLHGEIMVQKHRCFQFFLV